MRPEAKIEADITARLPREFVGAYLAVVRDRFDRGRFDLTIRLPAGPAVAVACAVDVEVKQPGEDLREDQKIELERLRRAGALFCVVCSYGQLRDYILSRILHYRIVPDPRSPAGWRLDWDPETKAEAAGLRRAREVGRKR